MDSELNILLNSIKEKTGIDITVYAESMKYVISTCGELQPPAPSDPQFENVFADAANNRTWEKRKRITRF